MRRLVEKHGCLELPNASDGYALLQGGEDYDLILLDPLTDGLKRFSDRLTAIVARTCRSSILLFVIRPRRGGSASKWVDFRDQMTELCRRHGMASFVGQVLALPDSPIGGEARHGSAIVFIPRRNLAEPALREITAPLAAVTFNVPKALGTAGHGRFSSQW